jgi:hypothetical protein
VNHAETKDRNPLFFIFRHKEPPFLSFHPSYTVYSNRIRELFGRFFKNGSECRLDGTGYRDFAHLSKPIKGLGKVPHPLNAQVRHSLPFKASKPMTASGTTTAQRPFASFQPHGDMRTDTVYLSLKTPEISPRFQLDDASTARTYISPQKQSPNASFKPGLDKSMAPEMTFTAPQTDLGPNPLVMTSLFLYFLEIRCNW